MLQQSYGFKNGDIYRFYQVVNNKKHFVNTCHGFMHSVQTFNQSDEATGYPEIDGCQFGMLGRWPWKERRANVDNIYLLIAILNNVIAH